MKKKLYLFIVSLFAVCLNASAQTDTRIKVTSVTGTSNIAEVMVEGNTFIEPTFTESKGSIAHFANHMVYVFKKDDAGEWKIYSEPAYTAGTYKIEVQVIVDGEHGRTHKIVEGWTATVDGQVWTTDTGFTVGDRYSGGWATSPEIIVKKTERSN